MNKKSFIKLLSLLIVTAFLISGTQLQKAKADTDGYFNGPKNECQLFSDGYIRNSKSYTYSYKDIGNDLVPYIENGIALWGSSISLKKASSASQNIDLTFCGKYLGSGTRETLFVNVSDGSTIIYSSIFINLSNFDKLSAQAKTKAIAYEIGHAFGLSDCDNPQSIMSNSYSASKTITTYDKTGMKVATGVHTNHTFGSFSFENTSYHKRSCSVCHGIQHQHHISVTGGSTCRICGYNGPITASLLE